MRGDRRRVEPARRGDVTANRDVHVDDLAVSVDSAVRIAPHAGDLDIGLVDEASSPDGMSAWSCRVDQQRCKSLHPAVQRDVIDRDAAFCEEFFQISV